MTEIADIVLTPDYHIGTITGRIQCQSPNIMEIPREHCWDSWRECSDKFWSNKHMDADTKDCDTCQYRFKCWTSRQPERIKFVERDFAQIHLRQLELYKAMMDSKLAIKDVAFVLEKKEKS